MDLGKLKQYAGIFGKGLIQQMAPGVAEGAINQLFHEANVDVIKLGDYVQNNRSLWDQLTPQQQAELKSLSLWLGDLSFITPELIVNAIKKDFWVVANLLVNWPEAADWLERQINELKERIASMDTGNTVQN
jgi:hypothetical protein